MTRATENAQAELVAKVLLAKGADPLARNNAGKTPRDLAKAHKSKKYQASQTVLADAEKARR